MITDETKKLREQQQEKMDKRDALFAEMESIDTKAESEKRALTTEEQKAFSAKRSDFEEVEKEVRDLEAKIEQKEFIADQRHGNAVSSQQPIKPEPESKVTAGADRQLIKPFRNIGEQLLAVYRAGLPGAEIDKRLFEINAQYRAYAGPSGMNQGIDSEGGFALQTDFAGMLFETAIRTGDILSKVDTYPVGANSTGARWVDIDETSLADASGVMGGVIVYWTAEADTVTASKPKLMAREMALLKLMGLAYATDEMLQDTTFITALYNRAFATAIQRKLEGDIIAGSGAGTPLGILNSSALISVAKETAQEADTVLYKNIVNMWARRWIYGDSASLVWLVHPDVEAQLMLMDMPVGTGGVPVFLPPGGASVTPYSSLMGRPVIPTDHASALGDQGDIMLVDLSEYQLIRKGDVQADTSIHIRFDYGETAFRFTFRANGQPKRKSALTIKNSSNTRSPYLTLDARA